MSTKKRLFEIMYRLNPEMIINEQEEQRNPSFVDDDRLSVGELKEAIRLYTESKSEKELLKKAEATGKDVLKCVVGIVELVGAVGSIGATGPVGVVMSAAGAMVTARDVKNLFKKLLGPKQNNSPQTPPGFMQLLNIDKEVSILLDDKIENEFVDFAANKLMSMSDTEPVPNFFEELRGFIKEKYAQVYNIAFSSGNPA